ncbi:MAG: ion channel [Candidatus Actinomarina sp.]
MTRVKNFFSLLETIFNSRRLRTILAALFFVVGLFGYLFYLFEPDIKDYGDGLWLALVTITTVGYGDIELTTTIGRVIASALMLSGLGLVATITAIVSAKFITNYVDSHTNDDVLEKLQELETEIEKIEQIEDNVLGKLQELETEVDELNKKIQ